MTTSPHLTWKTHTQRSQNVWVGIFGNHPIGALFVDGILNGQMYVFFLDMMDDTINCLIIEKLEQDPDFLENEIGFQQEGLHITCSEYNFWIIIFPFIGLVEGAYIEWLTVFPKEYLKSKLYITRSASSQELRPKNWNTVYFNFSVGETPITVEVIGELQCGTPITRTT